jgi:hypothetical protein
MKSPIPTYKGHSPWGPIQDVTYLGPDAVNIGTASHGGIWVQPEALERIPAAFRETPYSPGCWFEEDCDWAIPYCFLQLWRYDVAIRPNRANALKTLQEWQPEAYAALVEMGLAD